MQKLTSAWSFNYIFPHKRSKQHFLNSTQPFTLSNKPENCNLITRKSTYLDAFLFGLGLLLSFLGLLDLLLLFGDLLRDLLLSLLSRLEDLLRDLLLLESLGLRLL
jgi:hypothetical protein